MNFKKSLVVNLIPRAYNEARKKIVVPLEFILGVQQVQEKNYARPKQNGDYEVETFTALLLEKKFALQNELGTNEDYKNYFFGDLSPIVTKVKEDFNVVYGLLKQDEAAKTLFNE